MGVAVRSRVQSSGQNEGGVRGAGLRQNKGLTNVWDNSHSRVFKNHTPVALPLWVSFIYCPVGKWVPRVIIAHYTANTLIVHQVPDPEAATRSPTFVLLVGMRDTPKNCGTARKQPPETLTRTERVRSLRALTLSNPQFPGGRRR